MRALLCTLLLAAVAQGDIRRWDNGEVIPGTEGIEPGPGLDLRTKDVHYADLRSIDMTGAFFNWANLNDSDFTGSNLSGALMEGIEWPRANLSGVDLSGANMDDADLEGFRDTIFTDANLSGAHMRRATDKWFSKEQLYSTANYKAKDMSGMSLELWKLDGWDLSGQNLTGANLRGINLTNTNIEGVVINGATIALTPALLYTTASYQNHDLRGIHFLNEDNAGFAGADLRGQDLRGATLPSGQGVQNANLSGANLTGVSFDGVIVQGAIFSGAIGYVPPGFTRTPGDSNNDGLFNSSDLVHVFAVGQYEDDATGNSTFSDGDWNGDGDFNTSDLVTAFSVGAYEPQSAPTAVAVPEPTFHPFWLAVFSLALRQLLKDEQE